MPLINEKNVPIKQFSAHGGIGLIDIKFAFTKYQNWGNNNDAKWSFFGIAELPIGATAGLHKHLDTDEIFYILDGKATIVIDGESKNIKKGDIVLTLVGSSHEIKDVKKKLKFIVIEILKQ